MILVVLLKSFNLDVSKYVPILILIGVGCLVIVGYFDNKLGFYSAEIIARNKRNPIQIKMFSRFDDLENRLIALEKRSMK
jgi:putative Mn2+ efflux pump MntP